MPKKARLLLALVLLTTISAGLGLFAGNWYFSPTVAPVLSHATGFFGQERSLPAFQLKDHHGEDFNNSRLQGNWSLLFFGYTHCPDVCPTTLLALSQILPHLNADTKPQVVFVSVDPERDTPEVLSQYTPHFHPSFLGVSGDPAELERLGTAIGILSMKVPDPKGGDNYFMDHSTVVVLIDPDGRFVGVFPAPHDGEGMAMDLQAIINYYR